MNLHESIDASAHDTATRLAEGLIDDRSARGRMKVLVAESPVLSNAHGLTAPRHQLSSRLVEEYKAAAERLMNRKIDDDTFFDPTRFIHASLSAWIRSVMHTWRSRVAEEAMRKCREAPGEIIDGAQPLFATDTMPDSSKDRLLALASWAEEINSRIRDKRVRTARSAAAVRLALGFAKPIRPRFDELDLVSSATDQLAQTISFRRHGDSTHPAIPAIFDNYSDAELDRLAEHDTRIAELIISDTVDPYTRPHVRRVESVVRHFSSLGDAELLTRAVQTFFAFECEPSYDRLSATKKERAAAEADALKDAGEATYTRASEELGLPSIYSLHGAIARHARGVIRELHHEPDTMDEVLHA